MPPLTVSIPSPPATDRQSRERRTLPTKVETAAETVAAALLAGLFLWRGLMRGWQTLNTDFPNYYVAARLIREHFSLDRIYDWIWFQRIANHFGIEHQVVAFLGLTPFSALPIVPLAWLPVLAAKRVWLLINLVLLIALVRGLSRTTGLSARRSWIVALLAVIPLGNNFLLGQMHLLVLALLAAAYVSHMRGKQVLSGCCIAVASALKIYPLFFCLYFAVKKRWKALGAALICLAACMLLSYAIAGPAATHLFLTQQLPRLLQGESQEPFLTSVASPSALLHRLFLFEPGLNPHPLVRYSPIWSPLLFASLLSLVQAVLTGMTLSRLRVGFKADERETLEWSSLLCLLLVLSSAPATYHFVVLIGAAVPTVAALRRLRRYKSIVVFLFLYVIVCNLTVIGGQTERVSITTPLHYVKLWAGVALLVFYALVLSSLQARREERPWWRRPRWQVAAALVCGLWAVGFASAWRHQRGLCADCDRRIPLADNAYLRTAPVETSDGLAYVAMLSDGYHVMLEAAPLAGKPSDADELSFAAAQSAFRRDALWVERAAAGGARIFRAADAASGASPCAVAGEEPALSANGSVLAFLREDRGRGSLWFTHPQDCSGPANAARVTPADYDVRTLTAEPGDGLPGGRFLFSAVDRGREKIFQWTPGQPPRLLIDDGGDLDAPAARPDAPSARPDGRLAARKLIAGRWQLVLVDPASGTEKQLTFADCNAYAPSWRDAATLVYATDCERGLGLTALAWLRVPPATTFARAK